MMRTLYAGVSGLKNHQIRMDVIGNNISNVNTTGFKSERVNFQDMISQLIAGASEPRDNVGGVNPKQVGLGAMVASIDKLMHQGALQTTSKNTDLAITGEGFFILADGNKRFYTRNGNFDVDKDGWLVNPANG
ncbi:MAG: flagellar hook-basal body complex protein, partial [Leptospiraceae bacterium]|nr:flagellar hook-basal body complex protein [Leptospiraceae bacterium]